MAAMDFVPLSQQNYSESQVIASFRE